MSTPLPPPLRLMPTPWSLVEDEVESELRGLAELGTRTRNGMHRRSFSGLWRMGRMRLQSGTLDALCERYVVHSTGRGTNRHDSKRWRLAVRAAFSVASDLLEGGERARAIDVLCEVVHVRDAIEVTRCGGHDHINGFTFPSCLTILARTGDVVVRYPKSIAYMDDI